MTPHIAVQMASATSGSRPAALAASRLAVMIDAFTSLELRVHSN